MDSYPRFQCVPVLSRRHMVVFLERPAEIQRILESAHCGDCADIIVGRAKQFLRMVQPDFINVFFGSVAGVF